MNRRLIGTLALLGLLATPALADDDDIVLRAESGSEPAAGLEKLALDGFIGEFHVVAGATDAVRWELSIVGDRDDGLTEEQMRRIAEAVRFTVERDGDRLRLATDWDDYRDERRVEDGKLDEGLVERWKVTVPARLALEMEAAIGEFVVEGAAGGVRLDFNIGDVDVAVAAGDVDIDSNIGSVRVSSATASPGRIDLGVNIGEVKYSERGQHFEAGYGFPVGQSLDLDRGGEDDIIVDLNIGEIDVEVE